MKNTYLTVIHVLLAVWLIACSTTDSVTEVSSDTETETEVSASPEYLEIARYITPFGVGMCQFIDVSHLASRLRGPQSFKSYIDTWVKPGHEHGDGWQLTARFVFLPATASPFDFAPGAPWHPCPNEQLPTEAVVVTAFDDVAHYFKNWDDNRRAVEQTVDLPTDGDWSQVGLWLELSCPERVTLDAGTSRDGVCDAWDRLASIEMLVNPDKTPSPELINIWGRRQIVIGETAPDSSVDAQFDPVVVDIPTDATKVEARFISTGHSFGNTHNCAEFCELRHDLYVGAAVHSVSPWRSDCHQNPVSPQWGTWAYPRMGWCPGAVATAHTIDITGDLTLGAPNSLDFDIRLANGSEYINYQSVDLKPNVALSLVLNIYR